MRLLDHEMRSAALSKDSLARSLTVRRHVITSVQAVNAAKAKLPLSAAVRRHRPAEGAPNTGGIWANMPRQQETRPLQLRRAEGLRRTCALHSFL